MIVAADALRRRTGAELRRGTPLPLGGPKGSGLDEILMPGECGRRTLERRTREGIPLPPGVVVEPTKVADDFGITMPSG